MSSEVLQTKIDLRLEIEDVGDFEVIDFQMNFGLNEIPTATCLLAVGRNVLSTSQKAAIHESASELTSMRKAKVYATITGKFSEEAEWPSDETLIFDGRLAGTGFKRLMGQAAYSIQLVHWLGDLAFSSALSQQSHPANPSQYTFGAVRNTKTGAKDTVLLGSSSPTKFFTWENVKSDLWANCVHPWLCEISERDFISITGDLTGIPQKMQKNDLAKAALARIEGGSCGLTRSSYTPPLSLFHDGAATNEIATSIKRAAGRVGDASFSGSNTIWDLLTGYYGQSFLFSLVPQVDKAIVVPIISGLSKPYDVEIKANDYELAELSGAIPRPLRGVGVIGGVQSRIGAMSSGQFKLGGFWPQEGDVSPIPDGMIRILSAPAWIANIPIGLGRARSTAGTSDGTPSSTATTPVTESVGEGDTSRADLTIDAQGFYGRFAHAMYVNESLRGRTGAVSGKLRFDIAPGSTVKIEGKHEAFIGSNDQLGEDLYGLITKVSVGMNANDGRAGTGFTIAGHRTATENDNPRFTTDKHPLYAQAFNGAPLVDAYKV